MNTPTPAQALGEVMALRDQAMNETDHATRFALYCRYEEAASDLLEQHGQHFAGLEARVTELLEKYAGVVAKYDDAADKLLAMQDRAIAADVKLAEREANASPPSLAANVAKETQEEPHPR